MAIYETIFILDSLMPPKDIDTTIERYSGIIKDNNGTLRKVDKWGKRRLAYEIQKKQYGFYVAIEFEGPGVIPKQLESDYNYNDKVMRFLTYRYDKNKLKAMELEEKEMVEKATPAIVPEIKEVAEVDIPDEQTSEPTVEETPVEEISENVPVEEDLTEPSEESNPEEEDKS
jgi:small subunit ribosomal protein S6